MRLLVLDRSCNLELRQLLQLEYSREESLYFLESIRNLLPPESVGFFDITKINIIGSINTIILDHILVTVVNDSLNVLLSDISNMTLGYALDIKEEHLRELVGDIYPYIEASYNDVRLGGLVVEYVNSMLSRNTMEMMSAINSLVEAVYRNVRHLKEQILRGTLVNNDIPGVLMTA